MAKQDDYIRITARLPPEVHDALVEMANRTERSLNGELVARLQAALNMAEEDERTQFVAKQTIAHYKTGSPKQDLMVLVEGMSEAKILAMLEILKK